jgi:MFS superfamily sulfate permease-like transporter
VLTWCGVCQRSGVRSRLCSWVVAVLELAAFLSPVSVIAYVPRFFFGGLLTLIAADLMMEWLWHSRWVESVRGLSLDNHRNDLVVVCQ